MPSEPPPTRSPGNSPSPSDERYALRTRPWFETLRLLYQRFRDDQLAVTAGSLTFTTLIALVPLTTVMLAAFAAFPVFGRFRAALEDYFLRALVPDSIARPLLEALSGFAAKASQVGTVGLLVFTLTALALMFTIDRVFNRIWRVPKPRPVAQRVLIYWAGLTLGPLLLGASLSLTSYAFSASRGFVSALPQMVELTFDALQFLLVALGIAGLFKYVPNTYVASRHALAGGLFVSVALELAKAGLSAYLQRVPIYTTIYGAFATVPILLLWMYLGWVIVLMGAVMAAYAPSISARVVGLPDRPGEGFALALTLLRGLEQGRAQSSRGISASELAAALQVDPLQVASLLEQLQQLDWCGRLEEDGDPRWVLLVAPASTPIEPLVNLLLLGEQRSSERFRSSARFAGMSLADAL